MYETPVKMHMYDMVKIDTKLSRWAILDPVALEDFYSYIKKNQKRKSTKLFTGVFCRQCRIKVITMQYTHLIIFYT